MKRRESTYRDFEGTLVIDEDHYRRTHQRWTLYFPNGKVDHERCGAGISRVRYLCAAQSEGATGMSSSAVIAIVLFLSGFGLFVRWMRKGSSNGGSQDPPNPTNPFTGKPF